MHAILAVTAAHKANSFSLTFGEIAFLISVIMIAAGTTLGRKIENTLLAIVVQLIFTLGAGVLIAAAYPHKILTPLYHLSGGKLGIPH